MNTICLSVLWVLGLGLAATTMISLWHRHLDLTGIEVWPALLTFPVLLLFVLGARAQKKRARRALLAEVKLTQIVESIPNCCIFLIDSRRRILSAYSQVEGMFGFTKAELRGQPLGMLLSRKLSEKINPHESALPPTTAPNPSEAPASAGEFLGRRKDGTELLLEVCGCPLTLTEEGFVEVVTVRDITVRKRTQEALREREGHLRLVVEQMPAILWTTDDCLHVTSTVGSGVAALGLDTGKVVSLTMRDPQKKESAKSAIWKTHFDVLQGHSLSYEMESQGRSFQVRVDPLRDQDKKITGTIGIVLDITDRKQTLSELKSRLEQQGAVATLSQAALTGNSLEPLLKQAVQLVRETLEVPICQVWETLPGESGFRLLAGVGPPSEQPLTIPGHLASQAGYTLLHKEPVIVEDAVAEKRFRQTPVHRQLGVASGLSIIMQGKEKPFGILEVHSCTRRHFTHNDVHFLQAVANILSAAMERHQAQQAKNRLVAILEATTDIVAITNDNYQLLYLNRAGRELLGLRETENIARRSLAEFYPEKVRSAFLHEHLPSAIHKGNWSGETTLRGRQEREIAVSQVILAHKSADGNVEFFSTIARDLRERIQLEEQLRQAQKMEAIGRLAGGVAHDFNNLLCVINGYSEFLVNSLAPEDERHGLVCEIKKAGERAAALTAQLLAFSRKQLLAPKVFSLNQLVGSVEKLLRRLIGEDIDLVTVLAPELALIKADPNRLEQVLMNLAVNSRDAMAHGGTLTIATENTQLNADYVRDHPEVPTGPYVQLTVTDTGCGMDAETLSHLFEPFFTTKGVGKGTGLGLATVFGIVKQSSGHLEVASAPGRGTTFKIFLPQVAALQTPTTPAPAPQYPRGSETVLIVEDESGVRAMARRVLKGCGYTVLEATDGGDALTICEMYRGQIHLLLTDVVMPKLSGGRLSQLLTPLHPEMRVLYMSGYNDSQLFRHGIQTGEVDCILKPFTPEALARHVREALDVRKVPAGVA